MSRHCTTDIILPSRGFTEDSPGFLLASAAGSFDNQTMRQQIQAGQLVTLSSAQGTIERVAVAVLGDIVLVCRPEEYKAAQREGRKPISAGFRLADVLHRST
jgi:hypothetical protein